MGWEERNGRSYYYRKVRTPDGVRSEYVGCGSYASLLADSDWVLSTRREQERRARHRAASSFIEQLRAFDRLASLTRTLVEAHLTLEGFRLHKRQWRRRRRPLPPLAPSAMSSSSTAPTLPKGPIGVVSTVGRGSSLNTIVTANSEMSRPQADALSDLLTRCSADNPDPEDVKALQDWVARNDAWQPAEDLARSVWWASIRHYQNATAEIMTVAGLEQLRRRMGIDEADPVEGLLITQIVTAWAMLQAEQRNLERVTSGSYSLGEAEAVDKRVQRMHGRWIRAVESLEKVRALRSRYPSSTPSGAERAYQDGACRASALPAYRGDSVPRPEDVDIVQG